jgi:iron(III) transport system ATP-binding protein
MPESLAVHELSKTYPNGSRALTDVSLEVEPGTFLVLLGPSGSGKSTLLRCLAGIERITSGVIRIGTRTVADGRRHMPPERRDLSMVFQDYALWPHLVARDNVAFALRRRRLGRAACRAQAQAMLDRVGLGSLADRYPNELSGGEQQRVALARALVADTGLVLCDEPLSNLDADLRDRIRVEISSLVRAAGATTLYITHDQAEAFALADQVGILEAGRLVQLGAPEEIYSRPVSSFVTRFTGLAGELWVQLTGPARRDAVVPVEPSGWRPNQPLKALCMFDASDPVPAQLLIRPTAVRLGPPEMAESQLHGLVADVAFRGRGYEHAVDIPGGGRIAGVFDPRRYGRGEPVSLRFDPVGCLLFPSGPPPQHVPESAVPVTAAV